MIWISAGEAEESLTCSIADGQTAGSVTVIVDILEIEGESLGEMLESIIRA